jgi:hypothetical protein
MKYVYCIIMAFVTIAACVFFYIIPICVCSIAQVLLLSVCLEDPHVLFCVFCLRVYVGVWILICSNAGYAVGYICRCGSPKTSYTSYIRISLQTKTHTPPTQQIPIFIEIKNILIYIYYIFSNSIIYLWFISTFSAITYNSQNITCYAMLQKHWLYIHNWMQSIKTRIFSCIITHQKSSRCTHIHVQTNVLRSKWTSKYPDLNSFRPVNLHDPPSIGKLTWKSIKLILYLLKDL